MRKLDLLLLGGGIFGRLLLLTFLLPPFLYRSIGGFLLRNPVLQFVEPVYIVMVNIEIMLHELVSRHFAIFIPFLPHLLDLDSVESVQSDLN